MQLIQILSAVILLQLLLLILFLFTSRKGKQQSNRLLALFFLWLALNLIDGLLTYFGYYADHPSLAHLEDGLVLLAGPLLYFYTRSIIFKAPSYQWMDLLHLIPFVIVTVWFQWFYHSQSSDYQRMVASAIQAQTLPMAFYVVVTCIYLHFAVYLILSLRQVLRYRARIREQFSSIERINLNWLVFVLISLMVILAVSLVATVLPATGLQNMLGTSLLVPLLFIFVFTNLVVWKGLKQPEIFMGLEEEKKPAGSLLADPEKKMIQEMLEAHLHSHRPYLQPDLTLAELAEAIRVSPRKLSQVINEVHRKTFFDLVNGLRIDEACRMLRESPDPGLTISEVMYASGFNSKSSFHTAFRNRTGTTPTAFRLQALRGHA